MLYNLKKAFGAIALITVMGLLGISKGQAQGVITLVEDDDPAFRNSDSAIIPDKISLPSDGLLAPQSGKIIPKTGVQPKTGTNQTQTGGPIPLDKARPLNPNAPVVPKTGTIQPKTGATQPQTGGIVPKTGAIQPKTGGVMPKTGRPEVQNDMFGADAANNYQNAVQDPLGDNIFKDIDDSVFSEMSDLEKQTAILTLELRREKIRNEIEALNAQRRKAQQEEISAQEEKQRKQKEWEKEQERKILEERQKLRDLDIAYEKLRQENLLKSYKDKMLSENQKWIKDKAQVYKLVKAEKDEKKVLLDDFKIKLSEISTVADEATKAAAEAKERFEKEKSDLQTQISILKARLEAEAKANPFADSSVLEEGDEETEEVKLSDVYVVMEIRGTGGNLAAKLINKDGTPFMVKTGTQLQTGHVIDDITSTYVRADKAGIKDYLYFSAGGVLDKEPVKSAEIPALMSDKTDAAAAPTGRGGDLITSQGIPSIGNNMTIR